MVVPLDVGLLRACRDEEVGQPRHRRAPELLAEKGFSLVDLWVYVEVRLGFFQEQLPVKFAPQSELLVICVKFAKQHLDSW